MEAKSHQSGESIPSGENQFDIHREIDRISRGPGEKYLGKIKGSEIRDYSAALAGMMDLVEPDKNFGRADYEFMGSLLGALWNAATDYHDVARRKVIRRISERLEPNDTESRIKARQWITRIMSVRDLLRRDLPKRIVHVSAEQGRGGGRVIALPEVAASSVGGDSSEVNAIKE